MFFIILLLIQGQFLFRGVNGNEDIYDLLVNVRTCVLQLLSESQNPQHDRVMTGERLFSELTGYTNTISVFLSLSQQIGGGHTENLRDLENLYSCLSNILQSYQHSLAHGQRELTTARVPPTIPTGYAGRPRYNITSEQITHCLSLGMNWQRISACFGVSRRTLYRFREQLNIGPRTFTEMSDENLSAVVRQILQTTHNAGERYIMGSLRSRNIWIQRWRLRHCLQRLDPIGRSLRRRRAIHRRVYSVQTPNHLW